MDSLITVLVAVFCIMIAVLLNKIRVRNKRFIDGVKGMPGPEYYPIIGTIKHLGLQTERLIPTAVEMHGEYGDIFRVLTVFFGVIAISRAEYYEVMDKNIQTKNFKIPNLFLFNLYS
uniref:Cytochrome P450 n=1 Tax=Clastoptera arizonana TaxID=38151 RepID=A0A1B6CE78_9HEMI